MALPSAAAGGQQPAGPAAAVGGVPGGQPAAPQQDDPFAGPDFDVQRYVNRMFPTGGLRRVT